MLTTLLRKQDFIVNSFVENEYQESYDPAKPFNFEEWVRTDNAKKCFKYDTYHAASSDIVVYIGPSGKDAAAELGIAWASKRPIFDLHAKGEDFGLMRKLFTGWFTNYETLISSMVNWRNCLKNLPTTTTIQQ